MKEKETTCTVVEMNGRAVRTVKHPKTGKVYLCIDDLAIALGFESTLKFMRTEPMQATLKRFEKDSKSSTIAFVYPKSRTSKT